MSQSNIILKTDSYKASHWKMYENMEKMFSYFESRGGLFPEITFFGLQYVIMKHLVGKVVTAHGIEEAEEVFGMHFGRKDVFNKAGWEYILKEHGGYLPLRIKAVPEGLSIPNSNVLYTVENMDKKCAWLVNYLEPLNVHVWYPSTVATLSREVKKIILKSLIKTGNPELVSFKLHDFGFRGVSSVESAGIGAMAHLINFLGTDTVEGLLFARNYYDCPMAGYSIPAAEHSTISSWGRERENKAYARALEVYPDGLLAVVSDTYDIYNACKNIWGGELKGVVEGREGTLVIRPDSGNPIMVILKLLNILGEAFGFTKNDKGYKVLSNKVRMIWGDGINMNTVKGILQAIERGGWSADNIAFGMGGALLQQINRDTNKFAMKCSSVTIDGENRDVFKQPVDCEWKKSKAGRLKLVKVITEEGEKYMTVNEDEKHTHMRDMFETVFEYGVLTKKYSFADVRKNAELKSLS